MKKIENRNNEYIAQLIDTTPCHVSPLSYASNPKIILLKLGAYSFAWCLLFIVTKRISNWHNFWKWKLLWTILEVAVTVGSFEVLLQLCTIYSIPGGSLSCIYAGGIFCSTLCTWPHAGAGTKYAGDCFKYQLGGSYIGDSFK